MKRLCLGVIIVTSLCFSTASKVRRFSGNEQRGDWSWNRNEHQADAQTKSTSQTNWPSKGGSSGGSTKGKGDMNPNRDGSWTPDSWSSGGENKNGGDTGWNTEPQGNNKGSAYPEEGGDQGGDLEAILGGIPGMDFPNFSTVPNTDFDCSSMPSQGYYGDVEAGCQVFHICQPGNRKDSFLCPVGTIFNQKYFVCDWWFNVNCSDTPSHYGLNNEIYKDQTPVTEEPVLATTEKTLPWNSQDLDKKRPPSKSWGNPPPSGKQNPGWNDGANRRGSKLPNTVSTSREVSNSWSRSDGQREVTLSWGSSSGGSTSGTFGSSSTSSNSFVPTTKPIWFGIDGQPAKDQSSMSRRTGLVQTPAPFGTRMRKGTASSAANTWAAAAATETYETMTTPLWSSNSYGTEPTSSTWQKGAGDDYSSPTTRGWQDSSRQGDGNIWNNGISRTYSTTSGWLKGADVPETLINPTGIKGVWEQETTKKSHQNDHTDTNAVAEGHKGFVSKSDQQDLKGRKFRAVSNQRKQWGHRQTIRKTENSQVANRGWIKNNPEDQERFVNSNINNIPRLKSWK